MNGPDDGRREDPEPGGGAAACDLHRVCDACGALEDGPPPQVCRRCGADRRGTAPADGAL